LTLDYAVVTVVRRDVDVLLVRRWNFASPKA